jgi:hypothetical protein
LPQSKTPRKIPDLISCFTPCARVKSVVLLKQIEAESRIFASAVIFLIYPDGNTRINTVLILDGKSVARRSGFRANLINESLTVSLEKDTT